jgi:hypothetical protein
VHSAEGLPVEGLASSAERWCETVRVLVPMYSARSSGRSECETVRVLVPMYSARSSGRSEQHAGVSDTHALCCKHAGWVTVGGVGFRRSHRWSGPQEKKGEDELQQGECGSGTLKREACGDELQQDEGGLVLPANGCTSA